MPLDAETGAALGLKLICLLFVPLLVLGCGESGGESVEQAELQTVLVEVEAVVAAEELIFDGETPRAIALSERQVTVVYETGSCGGPSDAPPVPAGVAAVYTATAIAFTIDHSLDCGGVDTEAAAYDATIVVSTTEDLADRALTVTYGQVLP